MTAAPPSRCYTSLTADQSASVLTSMLIAKEPFFFARFGDGFLECVSGKKGQTCDREQYSEELGGRLLIAWFALMAAATNPGASPQVYIGDWLSASFDSSSEHARYAEQYSQLIGHAKPIFLHFEALLLMRESQDLVNFYRAVKRDPRKKLYMGPAENAGAANMLGCEHLVTPMSSLFGHVDRLTTDLIDIRDFDVLLYGAGMAGNIPVVRCWEAHPERTYINLGSALDPLGRGKSRWQQIAVDRAKRMFRELV